MPFLLPAVLLLTLVSGGALADEFSESFDGDVLDPETLEVTTPAGFEISVVDGKVVLTKLAGTSNGFANVTTVFTIKGDFEATVDAERSAATSGSAMGLLTSHISAAGFSDVYFSGTGNLVSNIFIAPVHAQTVQAVPSTSLLFRIRRIGNQMIHEYDAGSGFVEINQATNDVLAGPVRIGLFIGEEAGQTALAQGTFDDLAMEGDAFTPPCGNGVLEEGEACDDEDPSWTAGDLCNSSCEILSCGDTDDSGSITVVDALHTLRTSVGAKSCDDCICNVDSSDSGPPTTVSDALRILRKSVGQDVELTCPACTS